LIHQGPEHVKLIFMHTTGFFTHSDCLLHEMGEGHPECPQRLLAIRDRLLSSGLDQALEWPDCPLATLDDLSLAHEAAYIEKVMHWDQLLNAQQGHPPHYQPIDPDTCMNRHTFKAALRAVGAALAATDAVIDGTLVNAFCAVRPPGHHATRDQAMGFCIFNTVAIAILHAVRRRGLKRVVLIDFDVHHGNGSENILSCVEEVLMAGFYQHPFYPGIHPDETASNMLNIPMKAYSKGAAFKEMVRESWLPKLHAFKPQMIFVSAGFDAHLDDEMSQLMLSTSDYAWVTQEIMALAAQHAQGRIVSCLEGGYELHSLAASVEAHLRGLTHL
jgi:acetoin utilization deacetylase AcuC-like enzyme